MADEIIIEILDENLLIEANEAGPPGPSEYIAQHIAGASLGGHRAVVLDNTEHAIYADKDTPQHATKVLGITTGSAIADSSVPIQTYGEITEPSWAWTPGLPVYLGTNGLLTQAAPATGFLLVIGFAITATKIFIDIKIPIVLN